MRHRHQHLVDRAIDTAGYAFALVMFSLLAAAAIVLALTVANALV